MDDDTSIEDLCRPLSAKVMPRSALFNQSHEPMSAEEGMRRARQAQSERFYRKKKLAERSKDNDT